MSMNKINEAVKLIKKVGGASRYTDNHKTDGKKYSEKAGATAKFLGTDKTDKREFEEEEGGTAKFERTGSEAPAKGVPITPESTPVPVTNENLPDGSEPVTVDSLLKLGVSESILKVRNLSWVVEAAAGEDGIVLPYEASLDRLVKKVGGSYTENVVRLPSDKPRFEQLIQLLKSDRGQLLTGNIGELEFRVIDAFDGRQVNVTITTEGVEVEPI